MQHGEKVEAIAAVLSDEPSKKNYFLEKGYSDLAATIKCSFKSNGSRASEQFKLVVKPKPSRLGRVGKVFAGIGHFFVGIAVTLFGMLLTLAISIVHSLIVFLIMLVVYVGLFFSKVLDGAYRHTLGLAVACDRCKTKTELPGYKCPVCGRVHYRLKPGAYGVFKHTCRCGQRLPAAFFVSTKNKDTGERYRRRELDAVCGNPACGEQVLAGESVPLAITVAGAPSVGKSAYLTAVSHELIEESLPKVGCTVEHYTSEKENLYLTAAKNYSAGETIKTIEDSDEKQPSAVSFSFFIDHPKLRSRRLMHLFDIAGETFVNNGEHERQLQYGYAGVVLILDPMAIPDVRDSYEDELGEVDALNIGAEDINQVLGSFVAKAQSAGNVSVGQKMTVPVAVVINKIDQPGIRDLFSADAVDKFKAGHPDCKPEDVEDLMCRAFLAENRMGNFVTTADVNFKMVRYFACSAIGHARGEGEYAPQGVINPISWIISLLDKQLFRVLDGKTGQ